MNDKTLNRYITELKETQEDIAAWKAHPIEDCYIPIMQKILEFNADSRRHNWENIHEIVSDPLYKALKSTDYIVLNKDFEKFLHISAPIVSEQLKNEIK